VVSNLLALTCLVSPARPWGIPWERRNEQYERDEQVRNLLNHVEANSPMPGGENQAALSAGVRAEFQVDTTNDPAKAVAHSVTREAAPRRPEDP
jgi:hypothetical protein